MTLTLKKFAWVIAAALTTFYAAYFIQETYRQYLHFLPASNPNAPGFQREFHSYWLMKGIFWLWMSGPYWLLAVCAQKCRHHRSPILYIGLQLLFAFFSLIFLLGHKSPGDDVSGVAAFLLFPFFYYLAAILLCFLRWLTGKIFSKA